MSLSIQQLERSAFIIQLIGEHKFKTEMMNYQQLIDHCRDEDRGYRLGDAMIHIYIEGCKKRVIADNLYDWFISNRQEVYHG